jgi:hypothetical protein
VISTSHECLTGKQILELANKIPFDQYQLYLKTNGNKVEKVGYEQTVCFNEPGIEKFTTQKKSHQDGAPVKTKIQVDRHTLDAPDNCMTGKEILELAGKTPYNEYQLYIVLKGHKTEKVDYDKTICFDDPGIERFTTQKLKHQDGEKGPRREFKLPEDDEAFLDAMGYIWETIIFENLNYLILRGVKLPLGYNVEKADVAFRIDGSYPRTQIDMAFFHPPLSRADKTSINALTSLQIDGQGYQQWSRHRTPDNPWVEGVDCVATQIGFMEQWLLNEFKKRPHAVSA